MARIYTYITIMMGLSILLAMAGIYTGSTVLLNSIGLKVGAAGVSTLADVKIGLIFSSLSAVLVLGGIATIIIGFYTKSSSESVQFAGFTITLLGFIADLIGIVNYAITTSGSSSWISALIVLIYAPLIVGYIVSMVSFWRGND